MKIDRLLCGLKIIGNYDPEVGISSGILYSKYYGEIDEEDKRRLEAQGWKCYPIAGGVWTYEYS